MKILKAILAFFNKNNKIVITLNLKARLQPSDRHENFEDPIDELLKKYKMGEIIGGGTLMSKNGEVEECDVVIGINKESIDKFMSFIQQLPIPKGSYLQEDDTDEKIELGNMEGLAIYLNGTDLPDSVYESCDINFLIDELNKLLEDIGKLYSYWTGPSETALYFYGTDFNEMHKNITKLLESYPLCDKCRVIKLC